MKSQLNKELIESLNESNNQEFFENVNDIVYGLVSQAVEDISQKSPFIRVDKCVLLPVNEIYLGAFSQLSTYDYFLGVENPQIEFNSKTRKNFWKYVWKEFRASWRIGKKKYKQRRKEQTPTIDGVEKYKLSDFRHDLVNALAEYVTETSIINEYTQRISLIGREDFGTNVKINIYVCVYNSSENVFKLYNEIKNRYLLVNFGERYANLDYKKEAVGSIFVDIVKIFNAIYSKTYNKIPNQILVESLIWGCPNLLFDPKDVYKTFVNVANFIRLANPKSIVSICDTSKSIFEENLIVNAGPMDFSRIISMLDRFKY